MNKYINHKMCSACGGACCKEYAGSYIPADFKEPITAQFILSLLNSGKIAVDWWEGDAKNKDRSVTYYLRPRHVGESAVKGSWGGRCVNFVDGKGCSLNESDRPYQCRMLIPQYKNGEHNCKTLVKDKAGKQDCAIAWYNFQWVIENAIEMYHSKT